MVVKKLIDFKDSDLVKAVQLYADENHESNFNLAVRSLCKQGILKTNSKKCRTRCGVRDLKTAAELQQENSNG